MAMKKQFINILLACLLIGLAAGISACSSEEKTQPPKETTAPQPQQAQEVQPPAALEKKPVIEETPIVEPAPPQAPQDTPSQAPAQAQSSEPVQGFGTALAPEGGNALVAPELEGQATVTEEPAALEESQAPPESSGAETVPPTPDASAEH